jgi:hypothetical protein
MEKEFSPPLGAIFNTISRIIPSCASINLLGYQFVNGLGRVRTFVVCHHEQRGCTETIIAFLDSHKRVLQSGLLAICEYLVNIFRIADKFHC